jgi:3,4-dihydroxy 2-butanone 4-phosphate synthase/GTP cyclohydrolase II
VSENDLTSHDLSRADGDFRVVVLDGPPDATGNRPCAAVFGQPEDYGLVRIQSRCVYGEIFESVDCDCRHQLRRAITMIRADGAGVLVYLDQEGRGAGLLAKARSYQLTQRTGVDTFASYRTLGLPEDSRSYEDAAAILLKLGIRRATLLTNNPAKVTALREAGIEVRQQSLVVEGHNEVARRYLAAKARYGHTIGPSEPRGRRRRWRRSSS